MGFVGKLGNKRAQMQAIGLRVLIAAGLGGLLIGGFQNCAFEEIPSVETPSVELPLPYDFQPDTLAYLSCTGQTTGVNTKALFSFYVASHNDKAGMGLSAAMKKHFTDEGIEETEDKLEVINEAAQGLKLQLALRSLSSPRVPYTDKKGSYTDVSFQLVKEKLFSSSGQRQHQNLEGQDFVFRFLPWYVGSDAGAGEMRSALAERRPCSGVAQDCHLAVTYRDALGECKHCPIQKGDKAYGKAFKLSFEEGFLYANSSLETYFPNYSDSCEYSTDSEGDDASGGSRSDPVTCRDYRQYYESRAAWSDGAVEADNIKQVLVAGQALCPREYLDADHVWTLPTSSSNPSSTDSPATEERWVLMPRPGDYQMAGVDYGDSLFHTDAMPACQTRRLNGSRDTTAWDDIRARWRTYTYEPPKALLKSVVQKNLASGEVSGSWQCAVADKWMLVRHGDENSSPCDFTDRETGPADLEPWLSRQSGLADEDKLAYRRLVKIWPSAAAEGDSPIAFSKVDIQKRCVLLDADTTTLCYKYLNELGSSSDPVSVTYGGNEPFCGPFKISGRSETYIERYCPHYLSICHLVPGGL